MKLGIYQLHEVFDKQSLAHLEAERGLPIQIISVYRAWGCCRLADDIAWLNRLKHSARDIMLTWEPWQPLQPGDKKPEIQPAFTLQKIIDGDHDEYILDFAKELADFPRKIYLRPMHEMNGNWYPWCGMVNNNQPEMYCTAWQHLREIVSHEVASNVQWVWCPYVTSYPTIPENDMERYFPGDEATDWVALDGYNWGPKRADQHWLSFNQIFQDAYRKLTTISRRPIMIAETACSEVGGNKAEWIEHSFNELFTTYKNIRALVWFDVNKECDWRMDSSDSVLKAFKTVGKRWMGYW